MKYHPDDQDEINRLHAEFIGPGEPNNEQVMAFQDASYALGLKRGQLNGRAEGRAEAVEMILAMDAETSLDEFVESHSIADTGDYGSHWKEDELRNHFSVDAPAASELERCRFDSHEIIQLKDDLESAEAREAALQQRLNEADQRVDAMNGAIRLLREFRDVAYGGFLDNDHVRRTRTDLDAFLSQLTKDSPEVGS